MLHISKAEHTGDYRVRIAFDDGREGTADLRQLVFDDPRPVFAPLRDVSFFQQMFIDHGALCWPGGIDIAAEYLYFLAFRDDESLQNLFEEWGYAGATVTL